MSKPSNMAEKIEMVAMEIVPLIDFEYVKGRASAHKMVFSSFCTVTHTRLLCNRKWRNSLVT